jgi:hypothetical protein
VIGVILGTGPGLNQVAHLIPDFPGKVFGINNTFEDFDLDVWIACDPQWHNHYGQVSGDFDKWHWDKSICEKYGYRYIEGRWFDGLSTDPSWISYNHSSGAQALNLAVHYGCDPILLVGFDMRYDGQRHYFATLSEEAGEYPHALRKFSTFDGLLECYQYIADQDGLPTIINCTEGSAMTCFEMGDLRDFL